MAKKPTVNLTRKPRPIRCWGIVWRSQNARDGRQESLLWNYGLPRIFETRRKAREWIEGEYGYIRNRPDLRGEPLGWRMPKPVRITLTVTVE